MEKLHSTNYQLNNKKQRRFSANEMHMYVTGKNIRKIKHKQ